MSSKLEVRKRFCLGQKTDLTLRSCMRRQPHPQLSSLAWAMIAAFSRHLFICGRWWGCLHAPKTSKALPLTCFIELRMIFLVIGQADHQESVFKRSNHMRRDARFQLSRCECPKKIAVFTKFVMFRFGQDYDYGSLWDALHAVLSSDSFDCVGFSNNIRDLQHDSMIRDIPISAVQYLYYIQS